MGILFNALVVRPYVRWAARANARWRARKDAGERVLPLKPDTLVWLSLIAVAVIGSLLFA